jgi:hypothetical protein
MTIEAVATEALKSHKKHLRRWVTWVAKWEDVPNYKI